MASGIDLSKYSEHVIEGLIDAQLDSQLIDYYKLLINVKSRAGDSDGANECLERLKRIIIMDDAPVITKMDHINALLDDMDNWKVTVDLKQFRRYTNNKLIRRKTPIEESPPPRRKRRP
mgnify:FL=1